MMTKKTSLTLFTLLITIVGHACEICSAKQPKGFENITHGEGPEGNIDYIIMYGAIVIVGYTLIMSVRYLVKPSEPRRGEIKNIVLRD